MGHVSIKVKVYKVVDPILDTYGKVKTMGHTEEESFFVRGDTLEDARVKAIGALNLL